MTIVQMIQQARADADRYNEAARELPLEDFIAASDEEAGSSFAETGFTTGYHQTIYEYAFASRLLVHIEERQVPPDPRPKTLGELVTPKQLWYARSFARMNGLDADAICQSLFDCPFEEVSKRAASALIDHLKRKAADLYEAQAMAAGEPF